MLSYIGFNFYNEGMLYYDNLLKEVINLKG